MAIGRRILIAGAGAGAFLAAMGLVARASLPAVPANVLGLVAGGLLGALGARLGAGAIGRRVAAQLARLAESPCDLTGCPPPPMELAGLDAAIDALRQALARASRLRGESETNERLARLLAASPDENGQASRGGLHVRLQQFAATLLKCAGTLAAVNDRMASGAVDQSDAIARTTTTVEALSEKIDRISQHAEDAATACEKSRQEACRGLGQLQSVIEGMDRLRAQVEANGRKARRLGDRSLEIGTIVELIRGISSRTDMLALNATIESVRAGEHGRGFAVVAEEIRKLAERTADAAREIGTLIEAMQADTHESIRALAEEQTQMEQESQRVREAGSALARISEVAEHSAQLVDGISRSSNDQVLATQELVRSMQRISEVSHHAIEGTTEARSLIGDLTRVCSPLQGLVRGEDSSRTRGPGADETPVGSRPQPRFAARLARSEQPA